ncbi:anthrone oxygenase family protein [Leifsonia sp. NCR5]|uniref:anthrone oxygenase family protein n=1 Tax=Leifsonia sp. NCR5 TaxID=1978342 RepID=UPI000A18D82A|nr:anthrone oxygenase family protein [Leifsonia sp. NCR5]
MSALLVAGIVLVGLVVGVYWGPWIALTRTIATFEPAVLLPLVARLSANLAPVMTVLMPLALLVVAAVVAVAAFGHPVTLILGAVAFVLLALTLVVTIAVEVPIVKTIESWTVDTLPPDWRARRDRWVSFHLLRVIPGVVALALLATAAVTYPL